MLKKTLLTFASISLLVMFWPVQAAEGPVQRLGTGVATAIAATPNGKVVAVGSSIGVWFFTADTLTPLGFWDTGEWVERVNYSADGRYLRANGQFWDVDLQRDVPMVPVETTWLEHQCSPDGRYCAQLSSWSATAIVKDQDTLIDVAVVRTGVVHDVAWSANSRTMYTAGEQVQAWTIPAATLTADQTAFFTGSFWGVNWSPDGQQVATSKWPWEVRSWRAWDVNTGKPAAQPTCPKGGYQILPFDCEGIVLEIWWGEIVIYDNPQASSWHTIDPHTIRLQNASLNVDETRLVTSGADEYAYACPPGTRGRESDGKCHVVVGTTRVWNVDTWQRVAQLPVEFDEVYLIAGDTRLIGRTAKTLEVWNLNGDRPVWVTAVAASRLTVSPTGEYAATSSGTMVSVWRVATSEHVADLTGHTVPSFKGWQRLNMYDHRWPFGVRGITGLAFSPDGTRLAASSEDGTVLIWPVP